MPTLKKIIKRKKTKKKSYNINFNNKKLSNNNKSDFFYTLRLLFGLGDKNKNVIKHRDELLDKYKTILIKKKNDYYLPKGIKFYHCSLENKFVEHNSISFFGLDSNISLWYCIEMDINKHVKKCLKLEKNPFNFNKKRYNNCYKKYSSKNKYGYLYTFITQEEIKIKIIKNIINNPKDKSVCRNKKNVCFHPHFSYRGPVPGEYTPPIFTPKIYGLSIEVTLFYSEYKDKLKLLKREKVDIDKLFKNRNDKNYKPQNAVIPSSLKKYNN